MEVEKQSAVHIEQAADASRKKIEAYRHALEEEKERTQNLVITEETNRLTEALRELNQQTEEASLAAGRDYESLFQDPATINAIKEKIVATLLMG